MRTLVKLILTPMLIVVIALGFLHELIKCMFLGGAEFANEFMDWLGEDQ